MDVTNIGAYTEYYAAQNSSSAKLSETMKNTDYSAKNDDELLEACKEFESYFLEQVFKSMEKTVDCFKDEDSTSTYSSGMLDYFGDETIKQLAQTSTQTQGLGLAQSLYEQMKRNYNL